MPHILGALRLDLNGSVYSQYCSEPNTPYHFHLLFRYLQEKTGSWNAAIAHIFGALRLDFNGSVNRQYCSSPNTPTTSIFYSDTYKRKPVPGMV